MAGTPAQENEYPLIPQAEWRAVRMSLGLTAEQVAKLTGVDSGTVRRWESGAGTNAPRKLYEFTQNFSRLVAQRRRGQLAEAAATHPATSAQLNAARGFMAALNHYTSTSMTGATPDELRSLARTLSLLAHQADHAAILLNGKASVEE